MKNWKKIGILFMTLTALLLSFYNKYNALINEFENTARAKKFMINEHIELSVGFIQLMTQYGNDYLNYGKKKDSEYYALLHYDPATGRYDFNNIGSLKHCVGNLTGIGRIPASGIVKEEVNLALQYNKFFDIFFPRFPDAAWIYYTSSHDFINTYPWISTKDFKFEKDLKREVFYTCVTPAYDKERQLKWTPVYLDHAGKGMMITISGPVYYKDTFMGCVSLDLTSVSLSKMLKSEYETYLIDNTDTIIASSGYDIKIDNQEIKTDYKNSLANIVQNKGLISDSIQRSGQYYVYYYNFKDAPLRLFLTISVWSVMGRAALFSLPILFIGIFLFINLYEVEFRKKAETQLMQSLNELKTYQEFLENAAKYDFLTSMVNRRGLKDRFDEYVQSNSKNPVSFIMGDIDFFKRFNDTFGHSAGDKVLIEIAEIMKNTVSQEDIVCRWGGEEFVIMLFGRPYEEVLQIAEKIRKEIETNVIPWENSINLNATMTFGVVEHDCESSLEESILKADNALYYGKANGRNRVIDYKDIEPKQKK